MIRKIMTYLIAPIVVGLIVERIIYYINNPKNIKNIADNNCDKIFTEKKNRLTISAGPTRGSALHYEDIKLNISRNDRDCTEGRTCFKGSFKTHDSNAKISLDFSYGGDLSSNQIRVTGQYTLDDGKREFESSNASCSAEKIDYTYKFTRGPVKGNVAYAVIRVK